MPELNEDAKKEIAEAIKIVKEDRILKWIKDHGSPTPPIPTGNDPANPAAPPPGVPGADPTTNPPKKRKGVLWADMSED